MNSLADTGKVSLNNIKYAPLGYQLVESRLVTPGANTEANLGATPISAQYVWIYVDTGSVYVAHGEAVTVATGTVGAAKGNSVRLPFGGVMWSLYNVILGDASLHVKPTENGNVEVAYFRDPIV